MKPPKVFQTQVFWIALLHIIVLALLALPGIVHCEARAGAVTSGIESSSASPYESTTPAESVSHAACNPQACQGGAVFPVPQGGQRGSLIFARDGEQVCVDIRLEGNTAPITSYGYTVKYDPTRLTLQSIQRGALVSNFLAVDCNQPLSGNLECIGFDQTGLPANSAGVLATICFIASSPPGAVADTSEIIVADLRDGLQGLNACCNLLVCSNPLSGFCDGPAVVPAVPGDTTGMPLITKLSDTCEVEIRLKTIPRPADSLGFLVNFDPNALVFLNAQPAELTANFQQISASEIAPGTILCLGASDLAIPANSSGGIFKLFFLANCAIGDTSRLAIDGLTQDLAGLTACENVFICDGCRPRDCSGPALYVAPPGGRPGDRLREQHGDTLRLEVRMQQSAKAIGAFGFRLHYDPARLAFGRVLRGNLTNNFVTATARVLEPGTLICAGFGTTAIPANSEGALLQLRFAVNCTAGDSSEIFFSDLTDDVAGLNTCCNFFSCAPCDHDGDVNSDKILSPGDAFCVFETYLNGGILPASCDRPVFQCELIAADVNCDNAVTTQDALAIFSRALQGRAPASCFAATPVLQKTLSPAHLRLEKNEAQTVGKDFAAYKLEVTQPAGLSAFGLQLQFPAHQLQFAGVRRTEATQNWLRLEGREASPGTIIIGGFNEEPLAAESPVAVLEVLFRASGNNFDDAGVSVSHLTDDFLGAVVTTKSGQATETATPAQFRLYQNYPNPLHLQTAGGKTIIRYDLPQAFGGERVNFGPQGAQVELVIYNLQGQVVRQLFSGQQVPGSYVFTWDGRNDQGVRAPAGTYQYRLKAGNLVETRKLIIVK